MGVGFSRGTMVRCGFFITGLCVFVFVVASFLTPGRVASEEGRIIPGGTLSRIAAGAPLRVCADPANLPFSSKDVKQPGFDVEVAQAIAREIGAEASFDWFPSGWGRRALARLLDGECDLFPGLPASGGFAEANPRLILSDPYYVMDHSVVSPAGRGIRSLSDLTGKKLSVEAGSLADYHVMKQGYGRHLYRRFHPEEAFKAIAAGEVDASLMWTVVAGWAAKQHPEINLRLLPLDDPTMRFEIGMAMRKQDTDLRAAVNRALERIGAEKVGEILGRYGAARVASSLGQSELDVARNSVNSETVAVMKVADEPAAAAKAETKAEVKEESREGEMGVGQLWGMCTPCHGLNARGGGIVPSLKDFQGTDEEFVKTVLKGRVATPMRPWKGLLSEKQILNIRAHIKNTIPD